MPYLNLWPVLSPSADVVVHTATFAVPAGGGSITSSSTQMADAVAAGGSTGKYTFTVGNAPYYKCVGYWCDFNQATNDANLTCQVTPPADGSGTAATVQFFNVSTGAALEPVHAANVSVTLLFRKSPVP